MLIDISSVSDVYLQILSKFGEARSYLSRSYILERHRSNLRQRRLKMFFK